MKIIKLPIANIEIHLDDNKGSVISSLRERFEKDGFQLETQEKYCEREAELDGYIDALYTMLLAHAPNIDVTSPEYLKGVQAVVDSMEQNFS